MKKIFFIVLLLPLQLLAQQFSQQEISRWESQAKDVTIIRDNWGIPHVYGKTDADAVFGLLYAQCEDDFKRVEMNYIEKLGRLAEVKGKSSLYADLLIRLIIDSSDAIADYKRVEPWLKKLLDAFADGANYYLYKHPSVKTALLNRFEPWYPLLWTDGSIGAISTAEITETDLKDFYSGNADLGRNDPPSPLMPEEARVGSNGFAFAPSITASKNAILYINPHVTFYFRPEVHMVSEEGLNVYGAVTWGQFFIYQGFNEHCGWMHTSNAVDVADTYAEKISKKDNGWLYQYENASRPVIEKKITLSFRSADGSLVSKVITAFFTHHGPVMAKKNGQWISVRSNNRSMTGLIQSWKRIKAKSFADYKQVMELRSNTSNNTVYADAEGNIAYWHGNFIPVRDKKYNWQLPVDGSIAATEWKGLHTVDQSIHIYNPPNGWLQNCNSTPFTAAGSKSPKRNNYPFYMSPDAENFRGINAVRVLDKNKAYTIDKVIAAGYDNYLSAFEILAPALLKAFDDDAQTFKSYTALADAVNIFKAWDYRSTDSSVATTLAIEWATRLFPSIDKIKMELAGFVEKTKAFADNATPDQLLKPLREVIKDLEKKFGKWQVAWGEINRFQRVSSDIDQQYKDSMPSLPVGFASSQWGMLPSYTSQFYPGTSKRYGVNGNSFVCAVEFGKKIKAKSLLAGGESGDPTSAHFFDQGSMYSKGQFKDVLFYKEDVLKHAERNYHPGE